jgi:hypothetical protein
MDVEVAVVHVDVPPEDVGDERERRRVVEQLDERVVEADEAEAVEGVAVRAFSLADAVDRLA